MDIVEITTKFLVALIMNIPVVHWKWLNSLFEREKIDEYLETDQFKILVKNNLPDLFQN